jgi:hypothetical protein
MPLRNRNTQGGKSVSSDLAPRTSRTGSGQINDNWVGVFPPMPIPTFGSVTPTSGGWTVSITNYDSAATYLLTTTAGSVSQTSGTITQTGLGNNASATVTVTVSKTGFSSSIAVIAGTSQSKLDTPTLSASTSAAGGFTFTITNYDAANTYTLSTSAGSVSRSGATITQSGLGNSASATVSVTANRTGFVSSDTATRAGTSFSQLATPTLSAATSAAGGFSLTINNYDASNSYTVTTNSGSVSRSGSTITVSGLGNGASATVSVTATRAGFVNSVTATQAGTSFSQLATPTFSITATTCSGFTASITNYDAANTYTQSVSAGSVSRSSGTLTVTGLAKGQGSTITVNATRSGFVGSSGAVSSSSYAACTSCSNVGSSVEFCGCFDGIQWNYNIVFRAGNPAGCCPSDCPAIVSSCYSTGGVGVC